MRLCKQEGCGREHWGKGWCKAHWRRAKEGKDMAAPIRVQAAGVPRGGPCDVPGCHNARRNGLLCDGHWQRKKYGHPDPRGPLRMRRRNGARARRRKQIGTLPAELVERLARIARSRRIPLILLIESTLETQFPKRLMEAA